MLAISVSRSDQKGPQAVQGKYISSAVIVNTRQGALPGGFARDVVFRILLYAISTWSTWPVLLILRKSS